MTNCLNCDDLGLVPNYNRTYYAFCSFCPQGPKMREKSCLNTTPIYKGSAIPEMLKNSDWKSCTIKQYQGNYEAKAVYSDWPGKWTDAGSRHYTIALSLHPEDYYYILDITT